MHRIFSALNKEQKEKKNSTKKLRLKKRNIQNELEKTFESERT